MADPIGVFVRLPVIDEQAQEMYKAYCAAYAHSSLTTRGTATQAALLAIGMPVFDFSVPMACCVDRKEFDLMRAGHYQTCIGMSEPDHDADDVVILATQESIQAAIALRDSRIAMLEEELSGYRARLSELIAKEVAALKGAAS